MRTALIGVVGAAVLALPAYATPVGDIFYIAMENHNWTQPGTYTGTQQIKGNAAAPFINSLVTPGNPNAAQVSYASAYNNVPVQAAGSPSGAGAVHPSEPNYVWAEAGLAGARNDASPYQAGINNNTALYPSTNATNNVVNAPNFSAQLQSSGQTWRSYQEGTDLAKVNGQLTNTVLPSSQYTVPLNSFAGTSSSYVNPYNGSNQYNYAAKHTPQIFFTATSGGNDTSTANPMAHNYAPLEQLATDLNNNTVARYNWISPDQYNDMHSVLTGGFTYNGVHYTGDAAAIAQGDNFLSMIVPMIMASDAYKNNGTIVIWNDETEGETAATRADFTSMEIVLSPLAKGNAYTNTISYDHSSDLLTNQILTGQSCLAASCGATPLSDLYVANAIQVPEPGSIALVGAGMLGLSLVRRRRA